VTLDTFRGHVSESLCLIVAYLAVYERPRDRKVSETRMTVPSNQDVVLDGLSISVGIRSILHFTHRANTAM